MKKMIFTILATFAAGAAFCQTSWKFDHYTYLNEGVRQSVVMSGRHMFTDRLGLATYVNLKNTMGGGTLGLDYTLRPWITLSLMGGWDIPLSSVVVIAGVGLQKYNFSFTGAYLRIGEVLDLYELALMYNKPNLKAGVMCRNYFGVGPRIDWRIPGTPVFLWSGGLYEWMRESWGLMIGFNLSYMEKAVKQQ